MNKIQNYRRCRYMLSWRKKSIFMIQDFAINRNFAIFAPHLAYEVQ